MEKEFEKISELICQGYNWVAMDTEFPGVIIKYNDNVPMSGYKTLKHNVDMLKLIQVGISISNKKGQQPSTHTWQFNLNFNLNKDHN